MSEHFLLARALRAASACLVAIVVAACGGSDGGGESEVIYEPGCSVQAYIPSNSGAYQEASVSLSGTACVPSAATCSGTTGALPSGYQVTWVNKANAVSGGASVSLDCEKTWVFFLGYFEYVKKSVSWETEEIPLVMGANTIEVTVTNAVGKYVYWGKETIVVTRVADVVPPAVSSTYPPSGAPYIDIAAQVRVTFSELMDPTSVNTSTLLLTEDPSNKPVAASVAIGSSVRNWILTPASALSYATNYRITVTTGVRDMAGYSLSAPVTAVFSTKFDPSTTPAVIEVSPPPGSVCAGRDTVVVAKFRDYINGEVSFGLTGPGGLGLGGSVSCQVRASPPTCTRSVDDGLLAGSPYTATVSATFSDGSGSAYKTWTFNTSLDGFDRCQ
jgi:hypothetical protein